jgi:hypothetical protein
MSVNIHGHRNLSNSQKNDSNYHDKILSDLHRKVKEVYYKCMGDDDSHPTTLQMLANLENHMETLFGIIEGIPDEKLQQAEKVV